jgi:hypothetical protein
MSSSARVAIAAACTVLVPVAIGIALDAAPADSGARRQTSAATASPPSVDDRWQGLDPGVLFSLARRAEEQARFALRFACHERLRVAQRHSLTARVSETSYSSSYLLVEGDDAFAHAALRRPLAGPRAPAHVSPDPPPYTWLLLFAERYQPFFLYTRSSRPPAMPGTLEVHFRGALPFQHGSDIREREGVAIVDDTSHATREVSAWPRNEAAALSRRIVERHMRLRLVILFRPFRPGRPW